MHATTWARLLWFSCVNKIGKVPPPPKYSNSLGFMATVWTSWTWLFLKYFCKLLWGRIVSFESNKVACVQVLFYIKVLEMCSWNSVISLSRISKTHNLTNAGIFYSKDFSWKVDITHIPTLHHQNKYIL